MGKKHKEQLLQNTRINQNEEEEDKAAHIKKEKKKREKINVRIQTLREQPDKTSPLVGYFPTSFDPLKSDPDKHDVRVYRNVKKSNRLQLVVSPANNNKVDFVGTNYAGEGAAPQTSTYALGVLDKLTQTLKIVPIAANKIFRLEPKPRVSAEEEINEEGNLPVSLYWTNQAIRKTEKMEAMRPKEDPRLQEDIESKLEDADINKDALKIAATTMARNIPPHDISATTPQKAYPLEKIIFDGEWNYLKDLLNVAEASPEIYPSFVCNRVFKLDEIKDEYEMSTLACVFSYITHLIKFNDKHSMDGHRSAKNHKIPSILSQKFQTMFEESDKRRLSVEKRNLLISYVLVLTLFADGYRSDPTDVAKDLKMNAHDLRRHYEELGCKFVREGTVTLATLPVPLRFPENKRVRKRQR